MSRYEQNIVIDLEFTPVDKRAKTRKFKCEIIQIGAVRVDSKGSIVDSFSSFVKPVYAKSVSRAVQELTGIRTCDLANAYTLDTVLEELRNWIGTKATRYVTWSETDLKQLKAESEKKSIPFPEQKGRWLDLQKIYPRFMEVGNGRQMALRVAADWYGIRISEKDLHGAPYDAKLTAELLKNLITNDYLDQKTCLSSVMHVPSQIETTTFSIGEKFGSLLQLKAKLQAAVA